MLAIAQNTSNAARDEQADAIANAVIGQANKAWEAQTLKSEQAAEKIGDYKTALQAMHMLADAGNADAQFELGEMYKWGDSKYGIPQDYTEAVKWFRKAADQGDGKSSMTLGYLYFHGQGVPQDYNESMKWYRKAADQGEDVSRLLIGSTYPCAHCKPEDTPPPTDSYGPSAEEKEMQEEELDSIRRKIHQPVVDADEQLQRDQQKYLDQQQRDLDQQQTESRAREEQAYQQEQIERQRNEEDAGSSSHSMTVPDTTLSSGSNGYGSNGYGTGAQGWDGRTYIPVDPALTPGLTADGYAK